MGVSALSFKVSGRGDEYNNKALEGFYVYFSKESRAGTCLRKAAKIRRARYVCGAVNSCCKAGQISVGTSVLFVVKWKVDSKMWICFVCWLKPKSRAIMVFIKS